jgi:hypothetical protein
MDKKIKQLIRSLPGRQQVGLWVIFNMPEISSDKFSFRSSEFAEKMKRHAVDDIKLDESIYGKFIGGILSGLSRNNLLIKVSGDRDVKWTLPEELLSNADDYKVAILEVKTYWTD